MKTVHKFPLLPPFMIQVPQDAKVIHVGMQFGAPQLWVEMDNSHPVSTRTFSVVGTDQQVPDHVGKHIGTIVVENDSVVLHVYEDKIGAFSYAERVRNG